MLHLKQESGGGGKEAGECTSSAESSRSTSSEGTHGWGAGGSGSGAVGAVGGGRGNEGEVGACQAGSVAAVDDNGLVAEEVGRALNGGEVVVGVADGPGLGSDVAVLASEISGLAGLRSLRLARVELAALGGIEMAQGCGAVAVCWNGEFVDVIYYGDVQLRSVAVCAVMLTERAVLGYRGEACEVDVESDASSARASRG